LHASCRHAETNPSLRAPISSADTLKGHGAALRTARFRSDASVGERSLEYQTLRRPPATTATPSTCTRGTRLMLTMSRQTHPFCHLVDPCRDGKSNAAAPVLEIYLTTGALVASDHICAADRNLQLFSAQTLPAPLFHLSLFGPLRSTFGMCTLSCCSRSASAKCGP
jgi:hypothetical protein